MGESRMKHLFIINPAAGQKDRTEEFTAAIRQHCRGLDYEIAVSQKPGDCTTLARKAAQTGEETRIYACGGDGTLNEVVNGVAGYPNVSVTHYCGGSGNDFVRMFSDPEAFRDLSKLLDCEEAEFDLIQCGEHYSLNICSIGLDARIGIAMSKYKRLPLVSGSGAYILSLLVNLVRGLHEHYRITIGDEVFDSRFTLVCIANGRWYGGGFHPVPGAELNDGLLDILLVDKVNLLQVAAVIGKYKAGRYQELPQLVQFRRASSVTVACDKLTPINLDGEALFKQESTFTVAPHKIRFCYPKGLLWRAKDLEELEKTGASGSK